MGWRCVSFGGIDRVSPRRVDVNHSTTAVDLWFDAALHFGRLRHYVEMVVHAMFSVFPWMLWALPPRCLGWT